MVTVLCTPAPGEEFELCQPVDPGDFETINALVNGVARRDSWEPIAMRIIRENEGRTLVQSDSPWLGSHALIFRRRAALVMGPLLEKYGELLPVACDEAELLIYNPTCVLDIVDEAASSLIRFTGGRILSISRYVFRPEVLLDVPIFKISNLRVSPTFVSQDFVDLWRSAGLKGLEFSKVWPPS